MDLTPEIIFQNYQNKEFDKITAINFLISLIDNSNDEKIRINSLGFIQQIRYFDDNMFKFLENLLISDSNNTIRYETAKIIRVHYLEKSQSLLSWALIHESDIKCITIIIKALVDMDNSKSKTLLFEEVKNIKKIKRININSITSTNHFRKQIKDLLKKRKVKDLSSELLGEILLNYKTILAIKKKFYSVYYELKNARVVKLDLSDVEYEVRGWKAEFKNNIQSFYEIPGLNNLKSLEILYLSNNIISMIDGVQELSNLSYLNLSNNKIREIKDLKGLESMPSLQRLNLSGNIIANNINIEELSKKLNIKLEIKSDDFS